MEGPSAGQFASLSEKRSSGSSTLRGSLVRTEKVSLHKIVNLVKIRPKLPRVVSVEASGDDDDAKE